MTADPDDVLIGPGSKELMFLLQLVYYGDLVIPTPCWVSYAPQAQIIGRKVITGSARRYEAALAADAGGAGAALRSRTRSGRGSLILNYPSNPTGGTYGEQSSGASPRWPGATA